MNPISPELDQRMWTLAESHDDAAIEAFADEHPEAMPELRKRRAMVAGLKVEARRYQQAVPPPPVFVPRPVVRHQGPSWPRIVTGSLMGAAAFAIAATGLVFLNTPVAPPNAVAVTPKPAPVGAAPSGPSVHVPAPTPPVATAPNATTAPPTAAVPSYLKPQDVKLEGAPLSVAIQAICSQGGLKAVIGPGMPDIDVKVDYRQMNTIEMLKDLGRQYAFTAFDQGDGSVLVIPAVDESEQPEASPGGKKVEPRDTVSRTENEG